MTSARATLSSVRLVALLSPLLLAACAGSQRFVAPGGTPVARGSVYAQPEPVAPVTSSPVISEPLPPPGGAASAPPVSGSGPLPPPADPFYSSPTAPPTVAQTQPSQPPVMSGGGGQVATLGQSGTASRGPAASRDSVVGSWTAREATGGSCRVQLSSSPSLDLYRATASGCANRDLQKVNAWDYRDGEVYLYQQGGAVVARLRASDASSLNGAVARSGASLSMSR